MKVIFSRKGFDSEYGGYPSPILPDGKIVSLPIPCLKDEFCYSDLHFDSGQTYADLLNQLGCNKLPTNRCHLDPDLNRDIIERLSGWRPCFGQENSAEGHLENQAIGEGDIFLFFGWFRRTIYEYKDRLVFDSEDRQNKHVLFGYLQVGEKLDMHFDSEYPDWVKYHPHALEFRMAQTNNAIYVARETTTWNSGIPGAGTFKFSDRLIMTQYGKTKSYWRLPEFFKDLTITYHDKTSWQGDCLKVASKGQEFVVSGEDTNELENWVKQLIEEHAR